MRLPQPFVQILTAIASLVTVPFAHATSGDSTPFLLDTRNYDDSTPLFSVDTRSPDLIANTGITDSGGASFTITMAMLEVTGTGAVTFTLLTGPVHGTLFLDGIAQGAGATFTQAQIDAGLLSYQRAAGDPLTDTFEVAAMDDNAGLLGGNLSFAVAGIPGASGTLFLVDTRNYTDSGDSTVHTDNRAYLTVDTVPGSLRQAIANVAAAETVDFDTGLSGETIILGGTQLTIDKDLTIHSPPDGITVSGNGASRVFQIDGPAVVEIDGLTIIGGNANGARGGGVNNTGAMLTLSNSTFTGNTAAEGGAVASDTDLGAVRTTLMNCTLTGNTATSRGGGLYNFDGKTLLEHCTITGNTAPPGEGSGVASYGNTFTATEVSASIISANSSSDIDVVVVATNNSFTSSDYNLVGTATGTATDNFNRPGDQVGVTDPILAPLGDYGGPTQTMALRSGSPAINAASASALTTDQRGFGRVGTPDIGAYESGNAAGYSVWATEMINEGMDASFTGNADEDRSANGTEYALGTGVLISDPASPHNPEVIINGSGGIEITFGFNPIAAVDTRWIIERSTDLENFTEIYRYDGPTVTGTPQADISDVVGATSITVTDLNPPSPSAFYRFGAQTAP